MKEWYESWKDFDRQNGWTSKMKFVSKSGRRVTVTLDTLAMFIPGNDYRGFYAYIRRMGHRPRQPRHGIPCPRKTRAHVMEAIRRSRRKAYDYK